MVEAMDRRGAAGTSGEKPWKGSEISVSLVLFNSGEGLDFSLSPGVSTVGPFSGDLSLFREPGLNHPVNLRNQVSVHFSFGGGVEVSWGSCTTSSTAEETSLSHSPDNSSSTVLKESSFGHGPFRIRAKPS